VQGWQQATPVLGDFLRVAQGFDDIFSSAQTRYERLIPDQASEDQFKGMIAGWNKDLEAGSSTLRLFTGATKDQVDAMDRALQEVGAGEEIRKRWRDLGIGISDATGKPMTKEEVAAGGQKTGTDLLTLIGAGEGTPDSNVVFASQAHQIQVQLDSMQAQSDLAQRARQASFGMGVLATPPLSPAMLMMGTENPLGTENPYKTNVSDYPALGGWNKDLWTIPSGPNPALTARTPGNIIPGGPQSALNAEIPDSVIQSWNEFGAGATAVFDEINARAEVGIDRLKEFGLTDGQIAQIKAYGEEIKTWQEKVTTGQKTAFWQDYNRGLEIAKRNLGDMVGLLGKQSQEVKGVGDVQATNLGQQERIVLLKGRELTMLGLELQQRQISFQTSLAGFMSQGLTPEEIAARQDQAEFVANTQQKQHDLTEDITIANFKIVDENNLRQFTQAVIDLEKIPRDLSISIDTQYLNLYQQQMGALRDDTIAQAGIVVSQFQGVEAAAIQMAATIAAQSMESFDSVFKNAQDAISKIAPEYAKMLAAIESGGSYVPTDTEEDRRTLHGGATPVFGGGNSGGGGGGSGGGFGDTGGPGTPTGSYSGAGFSPTVHINVGSVGSQADIDDIVRAVERALNQKSSLYGLRAPVAS